jgi:hypothetical protein
MSGWTKQHNASSSPQRFHLCLQDPIKELQMPASAVDRCITNATDPKGFPLKDDQKPKPLGD